MTFKQWWQRLPQWLQVTVYTVLGMAAIAGVGYLGFQLMGRLLQNGAAEGALSETIWKIAGAVVLLGIVFGGIGRNSHRVRRRRSRQNGGEEPQ